MTDDDRRFDPVRTLTAYAEQLNAICSPGWQPNVFYEIMSGALIWSDETNRNLPAEVIWSLRFVVAYRTSLMLNEPREELKPMCDLGLLLFPKWVGFRPERREPSPELLQIFRRGDVSLRKCLRDVERQTEKEDAEPLPGVQGPEEDTPPQAST